MTEPKLPEELWGLVCTTDPRPQFVGGELTLFATRDDAENDRREYDDEDGVMVPTLVGVHPRYRKQATAYRHMLLTLAGMVPDHVAATIRDLVAWGDVENEACEKSPSEPNP